MSLQSTVARSGVILALMASAAFGQTTTTAAVFGTVVNLGGTPSDLVLDEARGRILMCEIRHLAEPSDHDDGWTTAYGCYQDRYERVGGRWWFAERHYRSMARTGREGAILRMPPGLGPLG